MTDQPQPAERVARAICEACGDDPESSADATYPEHGYRWQDYLPVADAAIVAMAASTPAGGVTHG